MPIIYKRKSLDSSSSFLISMGSCLYAGLFGATLPMLRMEAYLPSILFKLLPMETIAL